MYIRAFTAGSPFYECGQDALGQVLAGEQIRHGKSHGSRGLILVPIEPGQAGQGLDQQILARHRAPWTLFSITCNLTINHGRTVLLYRSVIQSQLFHHSGTEIHDHDICLPNQ